MKQLHLFSLLFIFFQSCEAQNKNKSFNKMEKIDIAQFDANKTGHEYIRKNNEGVLIIQSGDSVNGYVQKSIPPAGWFYEYKEYYESGILKTVGNLFKKGEFPAGVWIEYKENGEIEHKINYDEPFRMTIDSVFALLKNEKIPFSIDDKYNEITREVENSKPKWYVNWRVIPNKVETIEIDDQSGKILSKDDYMINKN